jgi:hypothetical protein
LSLAAATETPAEARGPFSSSAVLALVLVGIVAFAGFLVLATYAPELRGRGDVRAHALSSSAVGYRGAIVMLQAMDEKVSILRSPPSPRAVDGIGLVLTPGPDVTAKELRDYPQALRTLIVLPKWQVAPDPARPGFVRKVGLLPPDNGAVQALAAYEKGTRLTLTPGWQKLTLQAWGRPAPVHTGPLDGVQTISGPGWVPVYVDARGRALVVRSDSRPEVYVLSEPDLLNNHGLKDPAAAEFGVQLLRQIGGEDGVAFDVTLNGLGRDRSLLRLMLEPPWLAATLSVLAAAALMGWLALTRFGAAARPGRAIALGAGALVDNSAGLIRMAKKEPALGAAYAESTLDAALKASGGGHLAGEHAGEWLARAAARRGLADPRDLATEAARVKTNDELTAVAGKLHRWRLEMTGESS